MFHWLSWGLGVFASYAVMAFGMWPGASWGKGKSGLRELLANSTYCTSCFFFSNHKKDPKNRRHILIRESLKFKSTFRSNHHLFCKIHGWIFPQTWTEIPTKSVQGDDGWRSGLEVSVEGKSHNMMLYTKNVHLGAHILHGRSNDTWNAQFFETNFWVWNAQSGLMKGSDI